MNLRRKEDNHLKWIKVKQCNKIHHRIYFNNDNCFDLDAKNQQEKIKYKNSLALQSSIKGDCRYYLQRYQNSENDFILVNETINHIQIFTKKELDQILCIYEKLNLDSFDYTNITRYFPRYQLLIRLSYLRYDILRFYSPVYNYQYNDIIDSLDAYVPIFEIPLSQFLMLRNTINF